MVWIILKAYTRRSNTSVAHLVPCSNGWATFASLTWGRFLRDCAPHQLGGNSLSIISNQAPKSDELAPLHTYPHPYPPLTPHI